MWWSSPAKAIVALALLALSALGGCATASATRTLLEESDPDVRRLEEIRAEIAEEDDGGALTTKGGCPVCAW